MSESSGSQTGVRKYIPILEWLPNYDRAWLTKDIIAGLTVTGLLVPEGMAYAQLAGLPPQAVFYSAPIALILHAIFGSSKQLIVACSSVIAAMSAATVTGFADPGTEHFVFMTAALAITAGLISMAAGFLHLGRVSQFFSESVMTGFVFGLALVIAIKQLPKLFGIESGEGNFFERVWDLLRSLGDTHFRTLMIGMTCLAMMLLIERYLDRIPASLVVLIYGIVASSIFNLSSHGVDIVGDIPSGLASPRIPDVSFHDLGLLLPGAAGLALVAFAEAIGPLRSLASKHNYEVDPNQELIGMGAANVGAGMFQGFPAGSSLSNSAANDAAGAKTQLSSIVAAALVIVVALFLTPIFTNLPEATLGAIVLVAVSGMMNVEEMKRLFHLDKTDFWLGMIALLAVLTFEVLQGLLIAVIASLGVLVWRASQPKLSQLAVQKGSIAFTDVGDDDIIEGVPGVTVVRPDEEIFFANAEPIANEIRELIRSSSPPSTAVILDLERTSQLDVPSLDALKSLAEDIQAQGIEMKLSRVDPNVREFCDRGGLTDIIGASNYYPRTLGAMLSVESTTRSLDVFRNALLQSGFNRTRESIQTLAEHEQGPEKDRLDCYADSIAGLDETCAPPTRS